MVKNLYLEYIFKRRRNKEGENEKEEKKEGRREEEREKGRKKKEFYKSIRKRQSKGKWAYKLEQAFQNVNIQVINEDKNVLENKNMFLMHLKTKGL